MQREMGKVFFVCALVLVLLLSPAFAAAREKAGVLILPGAGVTREMTEDMTEVLSIELSNRHDFFSITALKEKLLARYQEENKSGSGACSKDISCLREVGKFLSLDVMVVGSISKDGQTFKIEITQVSMDDHPNRFWMYEAKGTFMLVARVQNAASDILSPQGTFVAVKTDIVNADVVLDGEFNGQTPVKLIPIKDGAHKLKVSKKGYDDFFTEFDCAKEQVCKVEALLKQTVPPPAVIVPLPSPVKPQVAEQVTLLSAERQVVKQAPSPHERGVSLQRILVYSTAGVAVVSAGFGGYFLWKTKEIKDYLEDNCSDPDGNGIKQCSYTEQTMRDKVSEAKGSVMLTNVFFGVAGATAIGSVLLFVLEPDNESTASIVPLVNSNSAGLVGTVRF